MRLVRYPRLFSYIVYIFYSIHDNVKTVNSSLCIQSYAYGKLEFLHKSL